MLSSAALTHGHAFLIIRFVALNAAHVHSGLCAETPFQLFSFVRLPAAAGSFLKFGPKLSGLSHFLSFFFTRIQTSNPGLWFVGVCVRLSCTFTALLLPRL